MTKRFGDLKKAVAWLILQSAGNQSQIWLRNGVSCFPNHHCVFCIGFWNILEVGF